MNNTKRYLSKSQFTRGMQCAKSLWLYRNKPELQDSIAPDLQARFDAGTEVGKLAHQWIKGGVLIEADHQHPEDALAQTAKAIANGAQVLYEAAFLHNDVLVRVDVMSKAPGGVWDIWEVKSTTKVEDVYILDAAIQRYVVEGAGISVGVVHIVHLNSGYVRDGALDLSKLFMAMNLNEATSGVIPKVPMLLAQMKAENAKAEPPQVGIGSHCFKPNGCSFEGHCWVDVPDYSVFNLAGARMDKKTDLWNSGYERITEIPNCSCKPTAKKCTCGFRLTNYQDVQRQVAKSGNRFVDSQAIREHLRELVYPYHFIDFEAVSPPVPVYDGTRPYQALAFQASIHRQVKAGTPLEHFEYLCDGSHDPRAELVEFLRSKIFSEGSLIAYHKSYEGNMLNGLAEIQRSGSAAMVDLLGYDKRLWDLAEPFKKAWWAEPQFEGSWSIKKVLPVLVPDMSYDEMTIAEGTAAMRAYTRLMNENLTPEERAKIMADLKFYCGKDTMAMVRILEVVRNEVFSKEAA